MKIGTIANLLSADILCGKEDVNCDVHSACASDMMSDVLAFVKDQAVLLTGLVNPQVIRTAVMMDMRCVVFVRRKVPTDDMIALAEESGIVLMKSDLRMFEACGILYSEGLCGSKEGTANA
ncbi:MAG: hypothetical protein IJA52_04520 [Clostridia bacterium]|nr:hypothetical protein [Clostridia bacterium]